MKENILAGFVILHYMAYDMTVECVECLLNNFGGKKFQIVIVDNASKNGSGKKLLNHYAGQSNVKVLLNCNNEGFARGNNVGYRYITDNYCPDYIIVMNNDVLIEQGNFLEQINKIEKETGFDVLGPDIFCPFTQKHQNPAHLKGFSKEELRTLYRKISYNCAHPLKTYCKTRVLSIHKKGKSQPGTVDYSRRMEDVVLHGACYIFSQHYIQKRKDCFCPDTFLYFEEDILHFECMHNGIKMVYAPEITVKHLEDVSTDASMKSAYRKFKMKKNEMKKSIEVLLRMMESVK